MDIWFGPRTSSRVVVCVSVASSTWGDQVGYVPGRRGAPAALVRWTRRRGFAAACAQRGAPQQRRRRALGGGSGRVCRGESASGGARGSAARRPWPRCRWYRKTHTQRALSSNNTCLQAFPNVLQASNLKKEEAWSLANFKHEPLLCFEIVFCGHSSR
jgi:hypothetical protein